MLIHHQFQYLEFQGEVYLGKFHEAWTSVKVREATLPYLFEHESKVEA